jgi:hypothetical protein
LETSNVIYLVEHVPHRDRDESSATTDSAESWEERGAKEKDRTARSASRLLPKKADEAIATGSTVIATD